jgi:hypothetical protein
MAKTNATRPAVDIAALPPTDTHSDNGAGKPFRLVFPDLHTLYDYDERIER